MLALPKLTLTVNTLVVHVNPNKMFASDTYKRLSYLPLSNNLERAGRSKVKAREEGSIESV